MDSHFKKLKEFFKVKKTDIKFKNAGQGHRLCDESQKSLKPNNDFNVTPRQELSESALRAGEAAINREKSKVDKPHSTINRPIYDTKNDKDEILKAYDLKNRACIKEVIVDQPEQLNSIYFHCPTILDSNEKGSYEEIKQKIIDYLNLAKGEDVIQASSLLMYCNNKDANVVETCINTIRTLLSNIIKTPNEEKFHKIRLSNEKIRKNIVEVNGAVEFLKGVGFEEKQLPKVDNPSEEESFLVISPDQCDVSKLGECLEILDKAEPIKPVLYRNTMICHKRNISNISEDDLSKEFFRISLDEAKRMNDYRRQKREEAGLLLTKEMRENLKKIDKRKYRFVLIRVILPDNFILQGTFMANDTLGDIDAWVRDNMKVEHPYFMAMPPLIRRISNFDQTIVDAEMAPCSMLRLTFENHDLNQCPDNLDNSLYLK